MTRTTDFSGFDDVCIKFLTSQKNGTAHTYKSFLRHILEFTGMTGQQILDSKRADKNNDWEQKVLDFKVWLKAKKTKNGNYYSDNAVNTAINTLRSFFDFYRTKLDFNQSESRKLNGRAKRVSQDYMLTNNDIKKFLTVADLREKYIVLLGKSLGFRAGDFITLTYSTFRTLDLDQEAPIFMGEFQTEKEGVTAHPFIDADALPIIKSYMDYNKDKPDNERILKFQDEELSTIIQKLAEKAKINTGTQHLRFHCFKKYLSDRLSTYTSESKWKQIIGKATSEGAYVSNLELREIYIKTMELTTINKENGNGKITQINEQVTDLNKTVMSQLSEMNKKINEKTKEINETNQKLTEQHQKIENMQQIIEILTEEYEKTQEFFTKITNGQKFTLETVSKEEAKEYLLKTPDEKLTKLQKILKEKFINDNINDNVN